MSDNSEKIKEEVFIYVPLDYLVDNLSKFSGMGGKLDANTYFGDRRPPSKTATGKVRVYPDPNNTDQLSCKKSKMKANIFRTLLSEFGNNKITSEQINKVKKGKPNGKFDKFKAAIQARHSN